MRATQDTPRDKRPFTHDRMDLTENTQCKLYSLLALYKGSPRRNPFERAKYSVGWMSGGFIVQKILNGKQKGRACCCLIWNTLLTMSTGVDEWVRVIAADMLNEGYQTMAVWHEGSGSEGVREKKKRESEKRRWAKKKAIEKKNEWEGKGTSARLQQAGSLSTNRPSKMFLLLRFKRGLTTRVSWFPVSVFLRNSDTCVGQREAGLRLIGIPTYFRGAWGLSLLCFDGFIRRQVTPECPPPKKRGKWKKGRRVEVGWGCTSGWALVSWLRFFCVCANAALPVCVCVCLYSSIYMWKPAHFQHREVSVCFVCLTVLLIPGIQQGV